MYILDFDYTIFDTNQLRQRLVAALASDCGIASEDYWAAELRLTEHREDYSIAAMARLLADQADPAAVTVCMQSVLADLSTCVYPDAVQFLERQDPEQLWLLTYGNEQFQQQKITAAGVAKQFDRVIITNTTKVAALQDLHLPAGTIMINDKGSEIDQLRAVYPAIEYIQIVRPGTPYATAPSPFAHQTIQSLTEL